MTNPVCGRTFDGKRCSQRGDHLCAPRANHVRAFFAELLVHTKGTYRNQAFELAPWQWRDIIRPLFGQVTYSAEHQRYVRRYRVAWIELARKNGKSELLAGMMLYLLVGDSEASAELYGVARDRDQAALVFDVAAQMVLLNPVLRRRLEVKNHNRRIIDKRTASVYCVIAADAKGAYGSNPSGVAADEILAWRDRSMWDAMRTGMGSGARAQPLMVAATTAGAGSGGFAAGMHAEMVKVSEDPDRAPHVFTFIRNTPRDANPFDERRWRKANPALDDFLSRKAMREEALEARNNPAAENSFRQFRLNQWVSQATRWLAMGPYDDCAGDVWPTPDWGTAQLAGRRAWAGMDLAARQDLTAWCLVLPDGHGAVDVLWRFWLPEEAVDGLDMATDGAITRWAEDGWLTITEGAVLDYEAVYQAVESDARTYRIAALDADQWSMAPVIQQVQERCGLEAVVVSQTYASMTPGMTAVAELVAQGNFHHHANPVARWCFDNVEVRRAAYDPELIRPDKPKRDRAARRIDAVPTAALAVGAWKRATPQRRSAYEDGDLLVV